MIVDETFWIHPDLITPAAFNPAVRTEPKNIQDLVDSMRKDGFWPYMPLLLGRGDILADGHRRWTAAKVLKMEIVPCRRIDKSSAEIWAELNGTVRIITSREVASAVAAGMDAPMPKYQRQFDQLKAIAGDEGVRMVALNNFSVSIIKEVMAAARYVGKADDKSFCSQVLRWMISNRTQRAVMEARRDKISPSLLLRKIEQNKPLRKTYV